MDHANTRALFDYWNGLRNGREAPYRSEIDPRRISGALATMFILEVLDEADIRFRLAGTGLCELVGLEPRGMVAGAVMEDGRDGPLTDLARQVVEEPGVGVMRVKGVPVANGEARGASRGEVLLLPMRSELGRLDRVLGAVNMADADGPFGRPPEPLRLRALGARLLPIEHEPEIADGPPGFAFGEAPAPFRRRAAAPSLTAIDGNPLAERAPREGGEARAPFLRIVKG